MGHALAEWQVKVRALVQVADRRKLSTDRIEAAGLRPAFSRFSTERPRHLVAELPGAGSPYLDLPDDWVPDVSHLIQVEMPARLNPPRYLSDEAWMLTRSPTDVTVEQIVTAAAAAAGTHVRLYYSTPWPFPTSDPTDDVTSDGAFEAVSALAASLLIAGFNFDSARRRAEQAAQPDAKPGGIPDQSLLDAAKAYEAIYLRYLGVDPTTPGTSTSPATSVPLQFDPQRDSMFHGGRW
jgi:hypothetical protein